MTTDSLVKQAEYMLESSNFFRRDAEVLKFYMNPEGPHPYLLCGRFASELVADFDQIEAEELKNISMIIENGVLSSDEDVSTMMVTGLIEGLIYRAESNDELWPRIRAWLGPVSRGFADLYVGSDH